MLLCEKSLAARRLPRSSKKHERFGCYCRAAESPAGSVKVLPEVPRGTSYPSTRPCDGGHVKNQRLGNKEQSAVAAQLKESVVVPTDYERSTHRLGEGETVPETVGMRFPKIA